MPYDTSFYTAGIRMDREKVKAKIEKAKTYLPDGHKDKEWMDGFNQGLDWAIRVVEGDKSAD